MNDLLKKFQPIDVIAFFTLLVGLTLRGFGIDGLVGTILITIVLFYFGKKEVVDKIREKHLPEAKFESIEDTIKRIAKAEGVDPNLALRVAKCESGLNPAIQNENTLGSLDRGLYQWNNRWHPEITDEVAFDVEESTLAFCKAVKAGHLDWWNASKKCWDI